MLWCTLRRRQRRGDGESARTTSLWSMVYADDARVVSQSIEQLRKIVRVIVGGCSAFDLTVSDDKNGVVCLRTKRMPAFTTIFSVEAAG